MLVWIVIALLAAVCAFGFWAIHVLAGAVLTLQKREAERVDEELRIQNALKNAHEFVRLNGFVQTSASIH